MRQWHLRTLLALLLLLMVFPFAPYMDGYTLWRLSPWVVSDTTVFETVVWSIVLIGPAVSAFLAGIMLMEIPRLKPDLPPWKSVRYLYHTLWAFVIVWLSALTFQFDDFISGRLTGSEIEGWICAIGMYLYPIIAIIVAVYVLYRTIPKIISVFLSTALNLGLFWFLLLATGIDQLSFFSWMYFAAIVILAIICIFNMQICRR